ncbi:hypothetical protein V8G54_018350, partial [Vigna mungo]
MPPIERVRDETVVAATENEPFKAAIRNFTEKIVNMMKAEKLFQTQGGPIIMSQGRKWDLNKIFILRIAFKFQLCILSFEWEIGAPGKAYAQWTAQMVVGLDTGVAWIMCKQEDALDPVAIYQVSVLLILNFQGVKLLGLRNEPNCPAIKVKNSLIFNAFVFCQWALSMKGGWTLYQFLAC